MLNAAYLTKLLTCNILLTCSNSSSCIPNSGFERRGWLKKTIRKVVNATVTIVYRVFRNAALGIVTGAIIGSAIGLPGLVIIVEVSIGGIIGLIQGTGDVMNGNVICVLPCRE